MRFVLPSALLLMVTACAGGMIGPPMPVGLMPVPADSVQAWVASTWSGEPSFMRFRFDYRERRGNAGGRGSATIAPPDSLRFDFAGPFGANRSAAFVVGDSGIWAEPEEQVQKLVPNYPILWAMLGRARDPGPGTTLTGLQAPDLTAWRYVTAADTVDYVLTRGLKPQLVVDVRQGGRRLGRVVTEFDADGRPKKARLDVPSKPARVELEFYRWERPDSLPGTLWQRPDDS